MPTYEYQCKECQYIFEEIVSLGKRDMSRVCPNCGQEAFRTTRIYAPYGIVSGTHMKQALKDTDG